MNLILRSALFLCLLLCYPSSLRAESEGEVHEESGRTATNLKEVGTLQAYNQQLRERGWHRNEANRFTDELSHLFNGQLERPLPNFTQYITMLLSNYQTDYFKFEKSFPSVSLFSSSTKKTTPRRGQWSHIPMYPTAGRIYDLELNPKKPKEMYANPDGDGIFFTKNGGRHWVSITDSIPLRQHRDSAENIIVDPQDFHHVFSISSMGKLYEFKKSNTGKGHWREVSNQKAKNGNAPQFKWVEAFRDAHSKLRIIGVVTKNHGLNGGWKKGVYLTEDLGKSWQHIDVKDNKLQEMAFHKQKRNVVYLGGQSKLYISRDAGKSFKVLKDFKTGDRPMFISSLYGEDANALYVVISQGNDTQVHFSPDEGKTWELRQDSKNKIGSDKGVFGRSGSSGWTSFFEVDPFDKNHLMASSVGSCESFDGGITWSYFSWGKRAEAIMKDGSIAPSPHGGHNADNHVLKFHPQLKGFRVKGCDAGIMMKMEDHAKNWTNINGDMPAFLWYSIIVNEFGDRYLAGNTQDVNVQTYRYKRWENEIGYEGDSLFINPYTNTTYYPAAKTEKGEGLGFLEPENWKMHSWSMPKAFVNYSDPNQLFVVFGRRETEKSKQLPKWLYVTRDRGLNFQRVPNIKKEVFIVNMSRSKPQTLTALTAHEAMQSEDMGKTWKTSKYPKELKPGGKSRKISGAIDPENPDRIWVGGIEGKIFTTADGGQKWEDISSNLPKGQVVELLYHEGSGGDLYALVNGYGVFYKTAGTKEWQYWMAGFNLKDFREIRIDYPSQKLLAASYARGAWEAPLMAPSERFFKKGFAIQQINDIGGVSVFEIKTDWVTPDYYDYQWQINGQSIDVNRPILSTSEVKAGDRVQVIISPRYSPKIQTHSAVITATKNPTPFNGVNTTAFKIPKGHLDLGVIELFGAGQNRTLEIKVKLDGPGVIAGNRRQFYRDAKGWLLSVDKDGKLSLLLSPKQNGNFSRTFKIDNEQATRVESAPKAVTFNQWTTLTFSISNTGQVKLFVDGKSVANGSVQSLYKNHSLNSVMSTCIFADSLGLNGVTGEVKGFTIWDLALHGDKYQPIEVDSQSLPHVLYSISFKDDKTCAEVLTNTIPSLK